MSMQPTALEQPQENRSMHSNSGKVVPFATESLELTVVIPCLNEAETIAECVEIALQTIRANSIEGEVLVADNGSSDGSDQVAIEHGARVVRVHQRGYGNALLAGIKAARGRYIIMGDADGSYDFCEIPKFIEKLRAGDALVQGCRMPKGGGIISPGAMPLLHRLVGNPLFSFLARALFKAPINDINCGLRGFTKEFHEKIDQRCSGMEFAVEMVLKGTLFGEKISEVPITLHRDKRISKKPHLRTFRDGWRTLRFYLVCSPRWLFLYPGLFLIALGLLGFAATLIGRPIGHAVLGLNSLLISSLSVVCGYQLVTFAVLTKVFGIMEGLLPVDRRIERLFKLFTLEKGLIAGLSSALFGVACVCLALSHWWRADFGNLSSNVTMYLVAPGVLCVILGVQTIFSSFFLSILGMKRN